MAVKLLGQSGKSHQKSCSVHQDTERNVPDLSRRSHRNGKTNLPRGLVTRQKPAPHRSLELGALDLLYSSPDLGSFAGLSRQFPR
jgi:hypothetical protein